MLAIFTVLHPLVDALSVSVLWLGTREWEAFLAYNFCAFALQLPLGIVLDAWPRAVKGAFAAGMAMVAVSGILALCGHSEMPVICFCCLGNALFHLTAGKLVLDRANGRGGPIGLFISTGAVGLLAGKTLATDHGAILLPLLSMLILAGGIVALRQVPFAAARRCELRGVTMYGWCMAGGLLAFVAWRSWVSLTAGAAGGTMPILLAGVAATWAGKAVGGYLGERLGDWRVVAASGAGSALLWLGAGLSSSMAGLAVIFLAQLATGPALALAYRATGRASGTAFGLNCLGIFAGSL